MNPRSIVLAKFSSVFLRLALGVSFLSAVADRFGLWGSHGQPNISWGDYHRFVDNTADLNRFLPTAIIPEVAIIATVAEIIFGVLLILGWKTRITALLSGVLLTTFALAMTMALGLKAAFNFSVFSAAGGALLLGVCTDFPFSLDEWLQRNKFCQAEYPVRILTTRPRGFAIGRTTCDLSLDLAEFEEHCRYIRTPKVPLPDAEAHRARHCRRKNRRSSHRFKFNQ